MCFQHNYPSQIENEKKRKMSWLSIEETKTDLDSTLEIDPKELTDTEIYIYI